VLFEVSTFEGYGRLSKRPMDEMIAGARVEVAPYKRSPGDFVLWKPSTEDQPGWESPWGLGRPGWHIECSAMIRSVLGQETIDIHGGGLDLQFPHHENERAQSCCAHGGAELARIWMHNGFLTMGGTKMSKSLGNIITPRELLDAGWPGEVLRLALLSAHYRQPLMWTDALLEQSKAKLDRLYRRKADGEGGGADPAPALFDDLNTPEALAALPDGAAVLGLGDADPRSWFTAGVDASAIEAQLARYRDARAAKDWAAADAIRDTLKADGIEISVAKDGTTSWRRA
jgi:cysteinyl-tRNA synthetase